MKKKFFDKYTIEIVKLFRISRKDLFSKNKKREISTARHLLYYMCFRRKMSLVEIQSYMLEEGYQIPHSSIIHGINVVEEKILTDTDYTYSIDKIESCTI